MKRKCFLTGLAAFACVNALSAAVGDVMATAETPAVFEVYTSGDATYAVSSLGELEEMLPVYCLAGDEVMATAYDGSVKVLCDGTHPDDSDSPVRFAPDKGGIWTLVNSNREVARIGVGWTVLGGVGDELAASAASGQYGVETSKAGPDRLVWNAEVLPVAYTADMWARYAPGAVGLSITSPGGTVSEFDLSGSGTMPFAFDKSGEWAVVMTMADGTKLSSSVRIRGGVALLVR